MAGQHIDAARAAYKATLEARRRTVDILIAANNSHNRAELLQIEQTLGALRGIMQDEKTA